MSELAHRLFDQEVQKWTSALRSNGYAIVPDALGQDDIVELTSDLASRFDRTPFCSGDFYGPRTKRFGSLLRRSRHAEVLVRHPLVLAIAQEILGSACDVLQLNLTQAIAIYPGAPGQYPHRDEDMWQGEKGHHEYLLNVIWPLTSFTAENGATRIYPAGVDEDASPQEGGAEVIAACEPGSAICFLGSTLHGAGANESGSVRQAVIVSYCLGWLKPYENQWLAYPPSVARDFSPELAALVGYRQHRPNLGNYEGQCPSILFEDAVPEHLGAEDALRPDQEDMLADFVAQQRLETSSPSREDTPAPLSLR